MKLAPAPRPRNAGRRLAAAGIALGALASLALAAPAQAAPTKESLARKALKQALDEDYLQTRFDAAEQKLRAAIQSCGKACSKPLRARLHVALGSVLAGGKKELDDARDEFVEALTIDPKSEPSPDLLSTEVSFAYEQARKKMRLSPGAGAAADAKPPPKHAAEPPPEKAEKDEPDDKPDRDQDDKPARPAKKDAGDGERGGPSSQDDPDAGKEPPKPAEPERKNWITITFSPDLALVSGSNVCTNASQAGSNYVCLRPDGTRYVGTPTLDNGDTINRGLSLSTLRVMLGYDRLIIPNVTLGARVGFAFNGASGGGASFLPLHAEGRFGVWLGHDPFAGPGVRPFFMFSGGVAQVDAKVDVQVLEDGRACGAANPGDTNSPCTVPSSDGVVEKRQQTLTVYKQNGLGYSALSFGVQFAPSSRVALHLAVRAGVTFPVVTAVVSPEGGLSVGF